MTFLFSSLTIYLVAFLEAEGRSVLVVAMTVAMEIMYETRSSLYAAILHNLVLLCDSTSVKRKTVPSCYDICTAFPRFIWIPRSLSGIIICDS